jgi:DNA modification methylase
LQSIVGCCPWASLWGTVAGFIYFKGNSKWGNKKAHTNKKNVEEYRENTRGYYEQGRNKRTVWSVNTQPFSESHFAVYPEKLIETPIIAGCPVDGIVLDPFMGAGTTALVALKNKRQFIGFELNPEYIEITQKRIKDDLEQQWLF